MSLPAPRLDDRSFQDLVDDAKRLVQQKCPQWTDHNVSDPGVTLIELFAWMTDILLYRVNRVPDRLYLKFLDLVGVQPFPATAAGTDVTFRLTAPRPTPVTVPAGTQVATRRRDDAEPVVFTVARPLDIVPCELLRLASATAEGTIADRWNPDGGAEAFLCFGSPPRPDDSLLVCLSAAVPNCLVALRLNCVIQGHGVDPRWPPLIWEAYSGAGWVPCEVESDATGGLNVAGDLVLHVPGSHAVAVLNDRRGGWLRCRVTAAVDGQQPYSDSPRILSASAHTIGGTAAAVHATVVDDEDLGVSNGVPGQRFQLGHRPIVPNETAPILEVGPAAGDSEPYPLIGAESGWEQWRAVTDFADSAGTDRVFRLDHVLGELALGPAVRLPDGSLRHYGAVPAKGARLRLRGYRAGGGVAGNVGAHQLTVSKSSIPYLRAEVDNRRAAVGGVDAETITEVKVRAPLALRARQRAVTVDDYAQLARDAAPQVGRVACVAADTAEPAVRVLVVPRVPVDEPYGLADLVPPDDVLATIARTLDQHRVVGVRIAVVPPVYQAVTVVAVVHVSQRAMVERVTRETESSLRRYLHPLVGGPQGTGWPFGRGLHVGEVYAVLQRVQGVNLVDEVKLYPADAVTGQRGEASRRVDIVAHALLFGYQHVIRVDV